MKNNLRHFTEEHRRKISESRKRLKDSGWIPYNKGLKTADRTNGRTLLLRNMQSHLKYDVSLEWLHQFSDIDRVKYLNRSISRERDCKGFTTEIYKRFIERFYFDSNFNRLYDKWVTTGDKWMKPSLDHIEAKANGGNLLLDNLQFVSWLENRAKVDIPQDIWDSMKGRINEYL